MKQSLRILIGVALLALVISACSPVDYNLYGTWRKSDTGVTLIFMNNGRLREGSSGAYQELDFVFSGPGKVTLRGPDQSGGTSEQELTYTLQGDTLTIGADTPAVFTRIK
jgi:hypothetical protein